MPGSDGGIGVSIGLSRDRTRAALRIRHPTGNLLTEAIVVALREAFDGLGREPHLRLVTIEGEGGDFSFGVSVPEHVPGAIERVLPITHAMIGDLLALPAVTAAVVCGRCLGGGFELALACDFIFAAEDASVGLPEIALGLFPPAAAALLPARVGYARATSAILTGASRPAAEWMAAGLIELTAPASERGAAVDAWFARHLAGRSAAALRHAVRAARGGLIAQLRATLPELERLYLEELMRTADATEGVDAFIHKRPPRWKDR